MKFKNSTMKKTIATAALLGTAIYAEAAPVGAPIPTLETAQTQFVDAKGIHFAYRKIGNPKGVPLVLLQHFTGTMDYWDPAVVNGLAHGRQVIVFDNTGVGATSGKVADNVEQMTADALTFIQSLGLTQIDLLGYSLGGMIAQQLAAGHPELVRKVILANTVQPGGGNDLMNVLQKAMTQKVYPDPRMVLFFTQSQASVDAGKDFLARTSVRKQGRDPESGPEIANAHAHAIIAFSTTPDPDNKLLGAIRQPVLIVTGSNDTMLPSASSYTMFKALGNAELIMYPDSNHGAIFQHHDRFVVEANNFLDR